MTRDWAAWDEVAKKALTRVSELEQENSRLQEALRRLAVIPHYRLSHGDGRVPNGFSCRLCRAEWGQWDEAKGQYNNAPEAHAEGCLLAASPPTT